MISVIVPVYNEEYVLREQRAYFLGLSERAEVIFVDGGSTDQTGTILRDFPHVIQSAKGRAIQMNAGAASATGQIYLFLHADTRVGFPALRRIEEEILNRGLVGGCLRQVIDAPGPLYRWIAWTGNFRAGLRGVFYGDQGIFVCRETFRKLGGFPVYDIGEDILFTKRLRRSGRVRMLDEPIYCSARRWRDQGVVRTTMMNARIKLGLMLGGNPEQLTNGYRDIR